MSITSLLAPFVVRRIGTRNALTFGLSATVAANLVFGLCPDLCGTPLDNPDPDGSGADMTCVQARGVVSIESKSKES